MGNTFFSLTALWIGIASLNLWFFLQCLEYSFSFIRQQNAVRLLKENTYFLQKILHRFFYEDIHEAAVQTIRFSKQVLSVLYTICFINYLQNFPFSSPVFFFFTTAFLLIFLLIVLDTLAQVVSMVAPKTIAKITLFFASSTFLLLSPFLLLLFLVQKLLEKKSRWYSKAPNQDAVEELLLDTHNVDPNDRTWITSFCTFKKRVAKEVMIPRIDITAIEQTTSLQKAAELFLEEGYSRIPVYKNSLDEITGVLLYKDLFPMYSTKKNLEESVESLIKPIIYAPENKKISALLQEFRAKQLHFAVIVNEYGGTEGIVTIEDILEELVGEIEDEYDAPEKDLFWKLPNGSWVVDAKMSIIDIAQKLSICIPQNSEYETLGGYIFYRAGTIPSKGWSLHHDTFHLEVLETSERAVEKIRITPVKKATKPS